MPERYWNYRIMRHESGEEEFFQVHEVHYEGGKVNGWTKTGHPVSGSSVKEIEVQLDQMLRALTYPVLDYKTGKQIDLPKES